MSALLLSGILCRASDFPPEPDQQAAPVPQAQAPSLALSPAVIMVKASPNASSAHVLTITNLTNTMFRFVLEAFDVVIRDGQRVFVPAGETEGGIARSAIFDPPTVYLNPGASAQVRVTLTVPLDPKVRAVVAIFHGLTALGGKGNLLLTGSLGTLITYNLSDKVDVRVGAPAVNLQTETSNLTISQQLENAGREPAVPKGTLAILRGTGELVGRVAIQPHRLLPGEKFNCAVEYPHNLGPGKYRAMVSFVHEGGLQTNSVEFQIQ